MFILRSPWLSVIAVFVLLSCFARPTQAEFFVANGAFAKDPLNPELTSSLFTIDSNTGLSAEPPRDIGFRVVGMAFDPKTGILFGATAPRNTLDPGSLITIDPKTGKGTLVGTFGLPTQGTLTDLAFDANGNLFGWGSVQVGPPLGDLGLYHVTTTGPRAGEALLVGDPAKIQIPAAGLAFGPDGKLYVIGNASELVYQVNPMTGEIMPGPVLDGAQAAWMHAMVFDDKGTLFGVNFDGGTNGPAYLVTIDPVTGKIITRGRLTIVSPDDGTIVGFNDGVVAIAFRADSESPVVPEPTTVTLMTIGLIGLFGLYWRRHKN